MEKIKDVNEDDKNLFLKLPEEVIQRIWSFLDEPSLDHTALVCHRFNAIANNPQVWMPFTKNWTNLKKTKIESAKKRSEFAHLYNEEIIKRKEEKYRLETIERDRKSQIQAEWIAALMSFFMFNRSLDYLAIISFILGTVFSAIRSQEMILWNWRIVLIPFYIPLFQIIIFPIIYFIFESSHNISSQDITPNLIILHVISKQQDAILSIFAFNFSLSIFWILLMVKLNNSYDGIPALAVVSPWFLLAITATFLSFKFYDLIIDLIYVLINIVTITLAILFIALKLDEFIDWNWFYVLVPVWFCFAFNFFIPFIFGFSDNTEFFDDDRFMFESKIIFWGPIFIGAPLLSWFVLVALNLQGYAYRNWNIVFAPIFVLDTVFFLMCMLVDIRNLTR